MKVDFEIHGGLQRHFPTSPVTVEVPAGATLEAALDRLGDLAPGAWELIERSACAVGEAIVLRSCEVEDGMVIALLPPVAGG